MADLVIENATLLTMDPDRRIIANGWVAVTGNRIEALGNGAAGNVPAKVRIDGKGGVAMPGFVSAHHHVIDTLLRGGLEQDRNLFDWMLNVYYGGLAAYSPGDCQTAARLDLAEAIRAGVMTINDNWGGNSGDEPQRVAECAEATLEAYRSIGARIIFARMFADTVPEYWGPLVDNLLRKIPGLRLDLNTLAEDTDAVLSRIETVMSKHHGSAGGSHSRLSVSRDAAGRHSDCAAGLARAGAQERYHRANSPMRIPNGRADVQRHRRRTKLHRLLKQHRLSRSTGVGGSLRLGKRP